MASARPGEGRKEGSLVQFSSDWQRGRTFLFPCMKGWPSSLPARAATGKQGLAPQPGTDCKQTPSTIGNGLNESQTHCAACPHQLVVAPCERAWDRSKALSQTQEETLEAESHESDWTGGAMPQTEQTAGRDTNYPVQGLIYTGPCTGTGT